MVFSTVGKVNAALLVGYWGQNGAGAQHGQIEANLGDVCRTTKYDRLIVSFLLNTDGEYDCATSCVEVYIRTQLSATDSTLFLSF